MRLSPTVLAFIAASGLVGLSSSQAKANPSPNAQTHSTTEQSQDPSVDAAVEGVVASLSEPDEPPQPRTLQAAQEAEPHGADALAPDPDPAPTAAPASTSPQAGAETAAATIQALRDQIHQHRDTQAVDPAGLMAQQGPAAVAPLDEAARPQTSAPVARESGSAERDRLESAESAANQVSRELEQTDLPEGAQAPGPGQDPEVAEATDAGESASAPLNAPSEESSGDVRIVQGSREDILQNAPELTPEQIERIRQAAEEDAGSQIGPPDTPAEEVEPDAEDDLEAEDDTEAEQPEEEADPRVLVAEVQVEAASGDLDEDLRQVVYDSIETRPGRTTTRTQLQQDINEIFATGFFAAVDAVPEDTDLGVRVTYVVQPNPVLTEVEVEGNQVLPDEVVDEIFVEQTGQIINLVEFQDGILELNQWYQDRGYVLAQVIAAPEVSPEGVVTLEVAEGVIEDIEVRFLNDEGDAVDDEGNPVDGRTHDYIVTREFETEPGDVFNQAQIERDFQNVFALQIFEDVTPGLEPGDDDPRKVKVIVNVTERNTGSVAAGLGFNFTGDLFGTVSFRQDNFGGNNQKLSAEAQLSTRDILFDISFTDPWIAGDPFRTSYTANAFARRSINLNFDGGPNEINLANGDRVRIRRFGGGISFSRPLGDGWTATVGTLVQNVSSRDADGSLEAFDEEGNPLTFSAASGGGGVDDLWTFPLSVSWDRRNDPFNPTSGGILRLNSEQSVPVGRGSIFMNRLRGSYSHYVPVSWINFNEGPQALAFNFQVGTIVGDVPPYEAFALGGTNSIRGYDEGEVGSGRSYAQFTAEYRFPLFSFLGAALFFDAGSDLGSGNAVPGSPGPSRGKPGGGFGYGAGLRVQTPLGPLRIDYGFNDQGEGRIHFGIGERF
jgi:outer membrane protein insertion porin family